MDYGLSIKPQALKDLKRLTPVWSDRILSKIERMQKDLAGDVKRLTDHVPRYRLRVGDYRVLFEVEGDIIEVYRVRHRSEAYDG